jgi:predicted transcriptional regulator of viral defense system
LAVAKRRLGRLREKKLVFTPYPKFHVIVPDENSTSGYVHPEVFIDHLMKHLGMNYYVSILSAALYHGASHQKPMEFQVCTESQVRARKIGDYPRRFITNSEVLDVPIEKYKTKSGFINISRLDATCYDLLAMWRYAGGLNNTTTAIFELLEEEQNSQNFWQGSYFSPSVLQRLGYMLEFLKLQKHAAQVQKVLKGMNLQWTPLVKNRPTKGCPRSEKWQVMINETLDPDI